ncbi:MAG: ribosomal protein S18-alanine N-acetyltransferase [Roseburia sp.]|nr:ribosomal protein S18-alanine N-acetyltransferase [Roseburia sp.]
MKNIIIRDMQPGDIEALSRLEAQIFSIPWSKQTFAGLLEHAYCHYLVAARGEELIGCVGMADICHEGNIDKVMVARGERGRGLAQRMLEMLFVKGEAIGITAYTLEVRVSNQAAIHIYKKLGFVGEGIRPSFYEHPREDALIMWRRQNREALISSDIP